MVQTKCYALDQHFPNYKHLHTPFGISALLAYAISQSHQNQLNGKQSNHIMIKLQV
jgi:hypothetical protein